MLLDCKGLAQPLSIGFVAAPSAPVTATLQLPSMQDTPVRAVLLRHRTDSASQRNHLFSLRLE